jgi:type III pantothenate kinase
MLLAIDIGNTSITFGLFRGSKLVRTFRLSSSGTVPIEKQLSGRDSPRRIDAAIICSVVPKLTPFVTKGVRRFFGVKPLIAGKDIKIPIKNNYKNPRQVGQDRLVDAIAARQIYGAPVIIIDSGTAVTFDFVSKKGEYEGGLIMPGIDISLKALYTKTALLPYVKLKSDKGLSLVGRDTVSSIKSGLLNGFGSMADGVVNRLRRRYGPHSGAGRSIRVIGTGGYIKLISKYASSIDIIDEHLTLKGLNLIYRERCAG